MLSKVSLDIRIAFIPDFDRRAEAKQLLRVACERLPKSGAFVWKEYSWKREWGSPNSSDIPTRLGNWADLIIGLGSLSAWERMAAWPEMASWRSKSKTILWLHLAPFDNSMEEMQSIADVDVEVMPHEVWGRIDPLISWLLSFGEHNRDRRGERAEQEERRRITQEWENFYWAQRHPPNPFEIQPIKVLSAKPAPRPRPTREEDEARDKAIKQWEEERQQAEVKRWHDIESRYSGATTITADAASQFQDTAGVDFVRVIRAGCTGDARRAHEDVNIADLKAAITDSVSCAIYSSPQWEGGIAELVQVWVYPKEDLSSVETEALVVDATARRLRAEVLGVDLSRGTRLSIALSLDPPCEISPPLATATWRGEAISISFAVKSLPVKRQIRALGTVEIRLDRSAAPIGVMHFRIELVPPGTRTESLARPVGETARLTESVFVSYASEDRAEVLRRVQGLKALGIPFFQDILSLSPGQRWAQELWRYIDQSDVFLLCWSNAARRSEWVRKEYLRANAVQGKSRDKRPHMTVLPLEGPPPPDPPVELAHLHFSDDLLYALKVEGDLAAARIA